MYRIADKKMRKLNSDFSTDIRWKWWRNKMNKKRKEN